MRTLPLYPTKPAFSLGEERADIFSKCAICSGNTVTTTRCMSADGEPGGLLVLSERPTKKDDQAGRPLVGDGGVVVRQIVGKHWQGPVVYDNAVRCYGADPSLPSVVNCRKYLASILEEAKPTRIIALGPLAVYALLGRSPAPMSTRRGYAVVDGVTVFFVSPPGMAMRNRFLRRMWEADLLWALTSSPMNPPLDGVVHVVETADDARLAAGMLRASETFSFDVETAGEMFAPSFRIVSAACTAHGERDAYVWSRAALEDEGARRALVDLLEDESLGKVGANIKYDQNAVLSAWGAKLRNVVGDTRLWRKLLDADCDASLDTMSELVGMGGMKSEQGAAMAATIKAVKASLATEKRLAKQEAKLGERLAPGTRRLSKKAPKQAQPLSELGLDEHLEALARDPDIEDAKWSYAAAPSDVLHRYNARDTVATMALYEIIGDELSNEPDIHRTWSTLVRDASDAVAQIEAWGMPCSRERVLAFDSLLLLKIAEATNTLNGYYTDVNWASRDQIADVLYKRLRLPVNARLLTETGKPSTDKEALEELRAAHPLVGALLDLRKAEKLRGTYAEGMLRHIRPDGRIHGSILLDGARSGRTSMTNPNLQNIPRPGSDDSKPARDCFAAEPGNVLLQIDYSQLELRVAALLSQDPEMVRVFVEGRDFHQDTAEAVSMRAWGITPDKVTKEHRSRVKPIVFGKLYGKGTKALARDLHCSEKEAQTIVDAVFGRFKVLDKWTQRCLLEARRDGVVWTYWNGLPARRRPMYDVASEDDGRRGVAERGSYNTPVQGSASDYCIASLTEVVRWIRATGSSARVCAPIHDALLIEVREDEAEHVARKVRDVMESQPSGNVPLVADVEIGLSWGSLKKMPLSR